MIEIWKPIEGYEGLYHVSTYGRVRSMKKYQGQEERILKFGKKKSKHLFVNLCKNGKAKSTPVHRLVGSAFLGLDIKNSKICACHKDDDPTNNRVENIFIGTQKDNHDDMIKKGRGKNKSFKGEKHWGAKLTDKQVKEILSKYTGERLQQSKLSIEYGVNLYTIHRIVRRKNWKHIL